MYFKTVSDMIVIQTYKEALTMKRIINILLAAVVCIAAFMPITAQGETYNLGDTDMHISVDDTRWYVFTRDNIKNNAELDELGISYDQMYDILYDNGAYMDAVLYYESGKYVELFVRKKALDTGIANLSNYKDSEVLDLAKELAKKQGTQIYSVYKSQYKFARLEYFDTTFNYYICEYVTVANKDNYTLTFQSTAEFTQEEYEEIEDIVDSVKFDIDPSLKEKKQNSFWNNVITKTLGGALTGGLVGGVVAIINKGRKKKAQTTEDVFVNSPEIE